MNGAYVAVTPSDTVPLPSPVRALYVGVAGDVAVFGIVAGQVDASATVLKAMPQGWTILPMPIAQVGLTGTTATNLVAALHNMTAFTAS
jgi:hypothetical protein